MKKVKYISWIVLILIIISSCNEDFLDTKPLSEFSEVAVWNDPSLAETFVNGMYRELGQGYTLVMLACYADEAMVTHGWGTEGITLSLMSPSDYITWGDWTSPRFTYLTWESLYKAVRKANIFFEKIDETPFEDSAMKDRLTGEAHFLRAYFYHYLVFLYGGVPIIDKAYKLDDDFLVARNSLGDCIDFIIDDLDEAISLLPESYTGLEIGRATKGAAMALKSRTLLYAASDLYQNSSWADGFSNPELISFTDGNQQTRWQAAKAAAKAVIDLDVYDLVGDKPATPQEAIDNFSNVFLQKETSEDIFVKFFLSNTDEDWNGYYPALFCLPNGYHMWGGNTPINALVDDFEMTDGTPFSWDNAAHAANPYIDRDPRFYSTVLYEGARWRERPEDVKPRDPIGIIEVGFWEQADGTLKAGIDTRQGPYSNEDGTYTGYYSKKFIDPTVDSQFENQEIPWRYMRYAEVLLNYAEACAELGEDNEARTYVNLVRNRVGMPDITSSGDELIEKIRHERRVELSYEELRFFDVRRWMIADQAYQDAYGVNILYKYGETKPTYTVIKVQDRDWNDHFYFLPIKIEEMQKNENLIQNPLY